MTGCELTRRGVLTAGAALAVSSSAACAAAPGTASGSRVLVAYFTRSGNTRVIAGTIQRALNAELFEIRSARPYPEDYELTVAQATNERESRFEPPLDRRVSGIEDFRDIYLGFPIWGGTLPPVIRSFLKAHDLRGKTLRPFITHGGYGIGDSVSLLARHASAARIEKPFVMQADQERRTMEQVTGWLEETGS